MFFGGKQDVLWDRENSQYNHAVVLIEDESPTKKGKALGTRLRGSVFNKYH